MIETLADFVCDKFGNVIEFCMEKWYWVLIGIAVLIAYFMNMTFHWW